MYLYLFYVWFASHLHRIPHTILATSAPKIQPRREPRGCHGPPPPGKRTSFPGRTWDFRIKNSRIFRQTSPIHIRKS